MELGGNGPCMIFNSADLQRAVQGAFLGKFRNGGQVSRKHIIELKNQNGIVWINFKFFLVLLLSSSLNFCLNQCRGGIKNKELGLMLRRG